MSRGHVLGNRRRRKAKRAERQRAVALLAGDDWLRAVLEYGDWANDRIIAQAPTDWREFMKEQLAQPYYCPAPLVTHDAVHELHDAAPE